MTSYPDNIPRISVGLLRAPAVEIELIKGFAGDRHHRFAIVDGTVTDNGSPAADNLFLPVSDDSVFEVTDVVIGIGFHWQQRESQRFRGAVEIKADGGNLVVINRVSVEDYLKSVISSEMSATASPALLKAHAVISRSWVLAQIGNRRGARPLDGINGKDGKDSKDEIIRWYDREDHDLFDVCADDHCQRYQGITRQSTPTVETAVAETLGEVLTAEGELCDARFSKCCGGVTERFESCWEDSPKSYLTPVGDNADRSLPADLSDERNAEAFILSRPDAFCNTDDQSVLSQVLNNYDRSTSDFYRWHISYTGKELGRLINRKSGIDLGDIKAMTPLERGSSGRITRLLIEGSRRSVTVGKELEIRRWLSDSHLYSSAFTIETSDIGGDTRFTLHGAGWGHGVGLCQIGAAVMGERGYDYRAILSHYYPGSEITKMY